MKLNPKSVQEFIEIYKKEFGKELTFAEAEEMGQELLSFYSLISKKPNDL